MCPGGGLDGPRGGPFLMGAHLGEKWFFVGNEGREGGRKRNKLASFVGWEAGGTTDVAQWAFPLPGKTWFRV